MRVLVTGGTGMVGRCINDIVNNEYNNKNFTFIGSKDCDLTDRKEVLKYFNNNKFDYIIHLAANVGGLYKNMNDGINMFSDNIKINENILEACYKYDIRKGIFCLSSCIYPKSPSKFPMDESMIHESPPHMSNEGYAYSKRMLELQCRQYNETYGTNYICLIPVNLYGPYDNFNIEDGHFIPSLMHRWYSNKLKCDVHIENYVIYGSGKPLRQFIYAPDFARLILMVLLGGEYLDNKPMICSNDEVDIKTMALNVAEVMNINNDDIILDTNKSDGCMRKTVSNMKLQHYYPNFKFTEHKTGLKETYKWFIDNYDTLRK